MMKDYFIWIIYMYSKLLAIQAQEKCAYKYPQNLGSLSQYRRLYALGVDQVGNIATGVHQTDIYGSISQPFVTYYNQFGNLMWQKYIAIWECYTLISGIAFQATDNSIASTKFIVSRTGCGVTFYLVFDNNGNSLYTFRQQSAYDSSSSHLYYDKSGSIYLAKYQAENAASFQKFTLSSDSSITALYGWIANSALGASKSFATTVAKGTQDNEIYFTSYFTYETTYTIQQNIHRVDGQSGEIKASYMIQTTFSAAPWYRNDIGAIDVAQEGQTQHIVGCGLLQYSQRISNHRIQHFMLSFDLQSNKIQKQIIFEQSSSFICMDAKYQDAFTFYTSANEKKSTSKVYLYKTYNINFDTQSAIQLKIHIQFKNFRHLETAKILPNFHLLFGGYYRYTTSNQNFEQAFFSVSNLDEVCSSFKIDNIVTTSAVSAASSQFYLNIDQILFTAVTTFSLQSTEANITETQNATRISLQSPDLLLDCVPVTYSPSTINSEPAYEAPPHIIQKGDFVFDLDQLFTGDQVCPFQLRLYYQDPSFSNKINTYEISSNLIIARQNTLLATNQDEVTITVIFASKKQLSIKLKITILDCATNLVTLVSPFKDTEYFVNQTTKDVDTSQFTTQNSYCSLPAQTVEIRPSTSAIVFSAEDSKIQVKTNDYTQKGIYSVNVIYINPLSLSNTYSFTFKIEIKCSPTIVIKDLGSEMPEITYQVGGDILKTLDLGAYFLYENNCGFTFTYQLEQQNGIKAFPSCIYLSSSMATLVTISDCDDLDAGSYFITVAAIVFSDEENTSNNEKTFKVDIMAAPTTTTTTTTTTTSTTTTTTTTSTSTTTESTTTPSTSTTLNSVTTPAPTSNVIETSTTPSPDQISSSTTSSTSTTYTPDVSQSSTSTSTETPSPTSSSSVTTQSSSTVSSITTNIASQTTPAPTSSLQSSTVTLISSLTLVTASPVTGIATTMPPKSRLELGKFVERPKFSKTLIDHIFLIDGQSLNFSIPSFTYFNQSDLQLRANFGGAAGFSILDADRNTITFSPMINATRHFRITLTFHSLAFKLVSRPFILNLFIIKYKQPKNHTEELQNTLPYIDFLKTEQYYSTFSEDQRSEIENMEAQISEVSIFGDIKIDFTQDIDYNQLTQRIDNAVINIKLIPFNSQGQGISDWSYISYQDKKLHLKISFQSSESISSSYQEDNILVEIILTQRLQQKRNMIASSHSSRERNALYLTAPLPNQLDKDLRLRIQKLGSDIQIILYLMIVLALSLSFSRLKRYSFSIWNLLFHLQLILSLPLFSSSFPSIVLYFNSYILQPSNMQFNHLIPTLHSYFILSSEDNSGQVPLNYKMLGYQSTHFISLVSSFVVVFIIGTLLSFLLRLINFMRPMFLKGGSYLARILINLPQRFELNLLIQLGLLYFIQILCSIFISLKINKNNSSVLAASVSLICTLAFSAFCIWKARKLGNLKRRSIKIQPETISQNTLSQGLELRVMRYKVLIENYKYEKHSFTKYYSLFYLRRLVFVISMLISPFLVQIGLQIMLTLLTLAYTIQQKPLENKIDQTLSVLNEVLLLCAQNLTIFLTPFCQSVDFKMKISYLYIVLITLSIFLNFLFILSAITFDIVAIISRHIKLRRSHSNSFQLDYTQQLSQTQFNLMSNVGQSEPQDIFANLDQQQFEQLDIPQMMHITVEQDTSNIDLAQKTITKMIVHKEKDEAIVKQAIMEQDEEMEFEEEEKKEEDDFEQAISSMANEASSTGLEEQSTKQASRQDLHLELDTEP